MVKRGVSSPLLLFLVLVSCFFPAPLALAPKPRPPPAKRPPPGVPPSHSAPAGNNSPPPPADGGSDSGAAGGGTGGAGGCPGGVAGGGGGASGGAGGGGGCGGGSGGGGAGPDGNKNRDTKDPEDPEDPDDLDDPDDPDDPDHKYTNGDGDSDDDAPGGGYTGYESPFTPAAARGVRFSRPAIHDFLLQPVLGGPRLLPAPFAVVGDMQCERLAARDHGKSLSEPEFTYNICAWVQALHNRALGADLQAKVDDTLVSRFDVDTRVALHQLFVLTSVRYKVLDLAVTRLDSVGHAARAHQPPQPPGTVLSGLRPLGDRPRRAAGPGGRPRARTPGGRHHPRQWWRRWRRRERRWRRQWQRRRGCRWRLWQQRRREQIPSGNNDNTEEKDPKV